ncbi:hypothetical protein [uncultured Jannaschia sp.]|uniref:hypothetical protein n=1 Tax=uncultured Jannaschia sp. TaxID=293347 RepID=UPI00261E4B65|nr:hypothetical protein [uncultured Jannaschia sp.]
MAGRSAIITQAEIARTVKAVAAAGVIVGRIEVDHRNGKVMVWPVGTPDDDGGIDAMIDGIGR